MSDVTSEVEAAKHCAQAGAAAQRRRARDSRTELLPESDVLVLGEVVRRLRVALELNEGVLLEVHCVSAGDADAGAVGGDGVDGAGAGAGDLRGEGGARRGECSSRVAAVLFVSALKGASYPALAAGTVSETPTPPAVAPACRVPHKKGLGRTRRRRLTEAGTKHEFLTGD